ALHPDSMEALRFHVRDQAAKKHFGRALAFAARAEATAAEQYPQTGYELDFTVQGVELLLMMIPDRDAMALRSVEAFLRTVSEGASPFAALAVGPSRIRLALASPIITRRIDRQRPILLSMQAGIESRLGEDDRALALAETSHRLCAGCLDAGRVAALVAGRASKYERARAIVDAMARATQESLVADTRRLL